MRAATATKEQPEHPFEEARRMMKDIEDELVGREALSAEHSEVERLIRDRLMELQRALFQAHLDGRAAKEREVEVEGADGMARTQVRESERTLETVFGEVTVKRRLYQAPGGGGAGADGCGAESAAGALLAWNPAIRGRGVRAVVIRRGGRTTGEAHGGTRAQAASGRAGGARGAGLRCVLQGTKL